ncbi:nicotinate mononucleotide-dependent phosphoribosyltransferase CobT [Halomicrococcus gelatinilyticus]|uniref:nicotinate mononucleotide-dependent phosphoribosyltransferase CobT n=1 Tax=Halomicrococcus gelatinilyticus TaxID=1702103 RepID=UPI002E0FF773
MRFVVVAGNTETARIDGISAAGADGDVMVHTPSADLEILTYGRPVQAPVVPVSPSGCPTPAVVTRAARELLEFETVALDAGLARQTGSPTVTVGDGVGRDVRRTRAVPAAPETYEAARQFGRDLPDDELVLGETIPGGTTTALGVLTALGERATVSSSLPDNPLALKRAVVDEALDASGLSPGDTADDPVETVQHVGDPVLAAVAGLVDGATDSGTSVTLAGGTQMAAAAALARHAGVDAPLSLATTSFVAADETAAIRDVATDLDLALTVTDPGFDARDHPAMDAYVAGEAKEGVGMGGALALVDRSDVPMASLRERIVTVYDRLVADASPPDP